jgi:hypothetical protein
LRQVLAKIAANRRNPPLALKQRMHDCGEAFVRQESLADGVTTYFFAGQGSPASASFVLPSGAVESARRRPGAVAAAMAAFRRFGVRHFVPYRDLMPVVATGMPPFLRLLLCIIGIDRGDAARARPPRSISD